MKYLSESWNDFYYCKLKDKLTRLSQKARDPMEEELDYLDSLLERGGLYIEDIADSLGCYGCYTWEDIIDTLKESESI